MRSALLLFVLLVAASAVQADTTLYVSPKGRDDAAGTRQAPLATLAGARDRARRAKADGGAITVLFAAGTYAFDAPVAFTQEESGKPAAPVIYRAAPGAEVRFTGGRPVTGWSPVTAAAVLKRLPEEARGKVRVADLRAQGITEYGKLAVRGFSMGSPVAEAEIFFNDEPMTLARWPNDGFRGAKRRITLQRVEVDTDRLQRWVGEKEGTDCRVVGCTIRNTGHRAVSVEGGTKHEVYGCDVYHCGEGGITMAGGDRPTLTPAGHNAENNHVHHYTRRARTYKTAITVSGVGSRIAHNLIHDGPHMALSAGGNDHVVEYNEIHNVVYESGDAGAFYVGRDWTQRGVTLRHNYFHQIVGATGHGGMTIYLDDQHCGYTVHGNLFERCSRAVFIGGGDDNTVTNNVFLDCWRAAHVDEITYVYVPAKLGRTLSTDDALSILRRHAEHHDAGLLV